MTNLQKIRHKITRLKKYEYWPYPVFYFPLYFYGLYLAARSGSFTYFTTANPSMKYSGVIGESKKKILDLVDKRFLPETLFISKNTEVVSVKKKIAGSPLKYPFIAKPDIGERGTAVEKIENELMLEAYFAHCKEDTLIQEFIDYPIEAGVLYYRIPGEKSGNISSIVIKDFLKIVGNGVSTVDNLIDSQVRAFNRRSYLKNKFKNELSLVLKMGEKVLLEPIGNHCRGTTFLNGNHLINPSLVRAFDEISDIEGFYYGRFDLKAKSIEDLYLGLNLKIIELNGVSSEPAHIYDPSYRLFSAYGDLIRHMKIIYKISQINHRNGISREPVVKFIKDVRFYLNRKKTDQSILPKRNLK